MTIGRWRRAAIVAWVAGALASCAHEEKKAAAPPPSQSQQAQQALQQAANSQQQLADAQKRVEAAHQDVTHAQQQLTHTQQQLTQAQQREERERASAQQLAVQSRQDLERANELAAEGQAAAEQAQGLTATVGRVTEATPSYVVLRTQDGRTMGFRLDQGTKVLVGSEQRSVTAIQQGADARVSYDPRTPDPTALTIRVTPVGRDPRSAPASTEGTPPPVPPPQQ
jgi:hypothetical protein